MKARPAAAPAVPAVPAVPEPRTEQETQCHSLPSQDRNRGFKA